MTTYLNKQHLLDELEVRIADLSMVGSPSVNHEIAAELSRLKRGLDAGNFDIEAVSVFNQHVAPPADVATTAQQDPLEAAADRIIGDGKLTAAVRDLPVGDVVSVETILWRRASEHEQHAVMIRDRLTQMREVMQGLLSAEQQEGTDTEPESESEDAPRMPHNAVGRRLEYAEYVQRVRGDGELPMTFARYFATMNGRR